MTSCCFLTGLINVNNTFNGSQTPKLAVETNKTHWTEAKSRVPPTEAHRGKELESLSTVLTHHTSLKKNVTSNPAESLNDVKKNPLE